MLDLLVFFWLCLLFCFLDWYHYYTQSFLCILIFWYYVLNFKSSWYSVKNNILLFVSELQCFLLCLCHSSPFPLSMLWLLSLRLSYNLLSAHPLIEGAALKAERMVTLDVFPRNLTWLLMQRCLTIKYFNYNLNAAFSACPFRLHSLQSKISVFSISIVFVAAVVDQVG